VINDEGAEGENEKGGGERVVSSSRCSRARGGFRGGGKAKGEVLEIRGP